MATPKIKDLSVQELMENYSWLIRPCSIYKEERSDCTSIQSRLHQHFQAGEFVDCSQWKLDYDNCCRWQSSEDPKALRALIESELNRREVRLAAHRANDVWKPRKEPPSSWNDPLPPWLEEKTKSSYLSVKAEEMKQGKPGSTSMCVIS